ncbi:hypothetical protein ABE525_13180 [Pseudomonas wadenswilerensis]|jgi:hypothetical protein|uniref:hypothetical protein n=1 Tax=Pseudomonas TaxID=286 RepID=UPI000FB69066|nr:MULTISPECIES: hypothetical protein [Pseudomonas]MCE5982264.1 hypothetical protein [Pseudomonas sp. LF19]UVM20838.1 hypothetical protein LOY45_20710 [Pseudomonas wadenswilerensis]
MRYLLMGWNHLAQASMQRPGIEMADHHTPPGATRRISVRMLDNLPLVALVRALQKEF